MSKLSELAARILAGSASDEELQSVGADEVIAIKTAQDGPVRRAVSRKASVNLEARTANHIASDETPDRMGDIIRVKGWDLTTFKKNPQLLFNHKSEDPPIGRVESVKKGRAEKDDRPALLTTSRFFEQEKFELADLIWRMVADGDLPAVSVGFLPTKTTRPEDPDERQELGLGAFGVIYEGAQLLELSVVTVPANPNALLRKLDSMVDEGAVEKSLAAMLAEEVAPERRTVVPVTETVGTSASTTDHFAILHASEVPQATEEQVKQLTDDVAALAEGVVELTSTFSSALAEVKASLEHLGRAVREGDANRVRSTDSATEAGTDERATDPGEDFYRAALASIRAHTPGPREG